jgi:hypothetical protein
VAGDSKRGYFSVSFDGTHQDPFGRVYRYYELEGVTAYLGKDGLTHVMVMLLHNEIYNDELTGEDSLTLFDWSTNALPPGPHAGL